MCNLIAIRGIKLGIKNIRKTWFVNSVADAGNKLYRFVADTDVAENLKTG